MLHENKSCVVVGGTHGIGLAIAEELLKEGCTLLIICSRKQQSLDQAMVHLAQFKTSNQVAIHGLPVNVSNTKDLQLLASFAAGLAPRGVDVLVSNVGVDPISGNALDMDETVFDKIFTSNVKAAWLLTKLFRPLLLTAGKAAVLFVSSTGGLQPSHPSGLYGASKSALIGLSRALSTELGPLGIRVNTICPGIVKTRMSKAFLGQLGHG
ncbi:hypothetical protein BASA81_000983 [Batrachochytrium salamandrivorans]|nr:hypothetical protein BASA81_000983 [Batrachochytrium salamandrivorans]